MVGWAELKPIHHIPFLTQPSFPSPTNQTKPTSTDFGTGVTTIHMHGINAVLMVLDLTLARYPYQLKHWPAPLGFIISYLVFNVSWWATTGTVVYPTLNYDKPVVALIMIAATIFVLLPVTHLLLWRWELACFAFSERRRYGKVAAGSDAAPLTLSDAVLARRLVLGGGGGEEALKVVPETPSTGGSEVGEGKGEGVVIENPIVKGKDDGGAVAVVGA